MEIFCKIFFALMPMVSWGLIMMMAKMPENVWKFSFGEIIALALIVFATGFTLKFLQKALKGGRENGCNSIFF